MASHVVTLGSDPEFFVRDMGGDLIPGAEALGGDVDVELPHGTAYPDGAAVEFTVTASSSPKEVSDRIFENMGAIVGHLKGRNSNYIPIVTSYHRVNTAWITKYSKDWGKRASLQMFGCDLDYNAYVWNGESNRPDPARFPFRSLGGHMHFALPDGWLQNTLAAKAVSAALDSTLGIVSAYFCGNDNDLNRKRLYGRSGTYRMPKYGYEYRVPPARFLLHNRGFTHRMFEIGQYVVEFTLEKCGPNPDQDSLRRFVSDYLGGGEVVRAISKCIDTVSPSPKEYMTRGITPLIDTMLSICDYSRMYVLWTERTEYAA